MLPASRFCYIHAPEMKNSLVETVKRFPKCRFVVVGDLIADEFLYGRIARVSREAPVLVLEYHSLVRVPGGAANAANNLLDLGCEVAIAGTVGKDEAGTDLLSTLERKGADTKAVRRLRSYATPVKTRILAGADHSSPQQVVRVDRVRDHKNELTVPLNLLEKSISRADGIIVSDYGCGTISAPLLDRLRSDAKRRQIPLVIDSRFAMAEFSDVTAITPNITELEAALGISIGNDRKLLEKAGNKVLKNQQLDSLLVTQGRYGMTLFQREKSPIHIPIYGTDEVADVTGAGDTVIAVFTAALACGAEPEQAARLANYAGGIVVMKRGTATVTQAELKEAAANG